MGEKILIGAVPCRWRVRRRPRAQPGRTFARSVAAAKAGTLDAFDNEVNAQAGTGLVSDQAALLKQLAAEL
jgi:hypothetical protein